MKMYYITRYEHNPNKETEYYCGTGIWNSVAENVTRVKIQFFAEEVIVKMIIDEYTDCDWHEVEIRN